VLIQAYVDESGGKGQGAVFVFSAMIGASVLWSKFSDKWNAILDESPSIGYFKMNEAAKLNGEFKRFSPFQRDEKVKKLCRLIGNGALIELHSMVKLDDFNATFGKTAPKPLTDPYFFPFHVIIMAIAYQLLDVGHKEPFEIFFDEHVIFGPRAKAWYPFVRAMADEDIRAIMPVEPYFRSDTDTLPLQAADLTAWLHRRENNEGLGEFSWVQDALYGLAQSDLSHDFTFERMKGIIDQSYTAKIDENVIQAYKDAFNDDWPPRKRK